MRIEPRLSIALALVFAALLAASPAAPQGLAPPQLREHSVILNWEENLSVEPMEEPGFAHRDVVTYDLKLYIGVDGKLSAHMTRYVQTNYGNKLYEYDYKSGDTNNHLQWRIESTNIAGYWRVDSGIFIGYPTSVQSVKKTLITFSEHFTNCKLTIVYDQPNGAHFILQSWGRLGTHYYISSASVSSSNCTIQQGNAVN
jgi:hypothetical protein